MALAQQNRLRSHRDFSRVHKKGKRAATRNLAMRALKRKSNCKDKNNCKDRLKGLGHSTTQGIHKKSDKSAGEPDSSALLLRSTCAANADEPMGNCVQFGISISKKVSKRAVVRNRIKRQLKAILRNYLPKISGHWQIVIVVRPAAVECSFDEFLRELEYLLKKLEIVT